MDKKANITNNTQFTAAFEPNELDLFDTPSYKFRLFMTKQALFTKQEYGTREDQITIAESGVTAIGIHSVRIEDAHGTLAENGATSTSLKIDIVLKEPFNASLYDLMYESSLKLGISNYLKCPYFLELVFTGNDSTTSIPTYINDKKWVWPIFINKVDATVDASGTTHEFTCSHQRDFAMTDEFGVIQEPMNIISSFTELEPAIKYLASEITNKQKYKRNQIYENIWDIRVSGPHANDLRTSKIIPENPDQNQSKHDSPQFTEGTSIQKVLDMLVSSTEFMQRQVAKSQQASEDTGSDSANDRVFKKFYKIHTDVEYLEYDPGIGDYTRKFIYEIVTYDIASVTISPEEGQTTDSNSQESFDKTIEKGRIRKHYNYLYTGLNQQVEKFDFRFNMAWHASLPRLSGNTSQFASETTSGQKANVEKEQMYSTRDEAIQAMRALERKKSRPDEIVDRQSATFGVSSDGVVSEAVKLEREIERLNLLLTGRDELGNELKNVMSEADKKKIETQLENYLLISDARFSTTEQIESDLNSKSQDEEVKKTIDRQLEQEQLQNEVLNSKFKDEYVEDLIFAKAKTAKEQALEEVNARKLMTLTYTELQNESDTSGGNNNKNPNRILFSALFSQALKSPNGDLLSAEIVIKGDPFWLPPSDPVSAKKVKSTKDLIEEQQNEEQKPGQAGLLLAENYLLFTAYLPDAKKLFSGQPQRMGQNTLINGVYAVLKSTHVFENGKFTQTLECSRQFLCDLNHVQLEKYVLGEVNIDVANSNISPNYDVPETPYGVLNAPYDFSKDYLISKIKTESQTAKEKTQQIVSNISDKLVGTVEKGLNEPVLLANRYTGNIKNTIDDIFKETGISSPKTPSITPISPDKKVSDNLNNIDALNPDISDETVINQQGVGPLISNGITRKSWD